MTHVQKIRTEFKTLPSIVIAGICDLRIREENLIRECIADSEIVEDEPVKTGTRVGLLHSEEYMGWVDGHREPTNNVLYAIVQLATLSESTPQMAAAAQWAWGVLALRKESGE